MGYPRPALPRPYRLRPRPRAEQRRLLPARQAALTSRGGAGPPRRGPMGGGVVKGGTRVTAAGSDRGGQRERGADTGQSEGLSWTT